MASIEKPWMVFVDGENLTIRAQELAVKQQIDLTDKSCFPHYKENTYFWPSSLYVNGLWCPPRVHTTSRPERCYYYTSTRGDQKAADDVHDKLAEMGFSPEVTRKQSNQKKSKGVDITLTKDMLVHAFLNNYDVAVLVSGDGDFCPVVAEVRRLGKYVVVAFFGEDDGLSPHLRRAADQYYPLNLLAGLPGPARKLVARPQKSQMTLDVPSPLKSRLKRLGKLRTPERNIPDEAVTAAVTALERYVEEEERKEGLPPLATS